MLEKIVTSPYTGFVLAIATVFSAVFAVYAWRKGKKLKRISYSCSSNVLVLNGTSRIKKVQVLYDGQEVQDLSVSHFFIWNSGNEVISPADIVDSMPLCIRNVGKAKILEAGIVGVNEPTNGFCIKDADENKAIFDFDYFAQNEGCQVQIIHSGPSSELEVICKIKGGLGVLDASASGRKKENNKSKERLALLREFLPYIIIALVMMLFGVVFSFLIRQGLLPEKPSPWITVPLGIGVFISSFWIADGIIKHAEKQYGMAIPKSLRKNSSKTK